jgi:tRNA A37 threonylcarbamoyladenosine biosynthesis protein TsaE
MVYFASNVHSLTHCRLFVRTYRIHHMDLYRLPGTQAQEFSPLNLDHVFRNCLSLIEWPIRLPDSLVPSERLEITITMAAMDEGTDDSDDNKPRMLTLTPLSDQWHQRIRTIRDEGYVDDLLVAG